MKAVEAKFLARQAHLDDNLFMQEAKLQHELKALRTSLEEANAEVEETSLATSNPGLQNKVRVMDRRLFLVA